MDSGTRRESDGLEDRELPGSPVTVFSGERNGKYPQGNSLLIRGTRESVLIELPLGLLPRRDRLPVVDRVLREPCSLDAIGRHRFVYLSNDRVPFADSVEARSMGPHLDRLVRDGRVIALASGMFRASG